MILDAIIALFGSIIGSLIQGVILVCALIINPLLAAVEALIGLVIDGFSIGRIRRKKLQSNGFPVVGVAMIVVILGAVAWFTVAPKVLNRDISMVAEDGHSLPFAELIVHSGDNENHLRTDNAGHVTIPRFGFTAISVKDPRYIEKKWHRSDIKNELVVQRTLLGSGLDKLADKFLKPAKQ